MEKKENIRNFCILSHIDHGKSTLADRFLELTKTIPQERMRPQYLDMMDLEREKGITIKMAPVRMKYQLPPDLQKIFNFQFSIFNLIDTPGHVDFSYEVSRALAAVEGAILLVDATKGVQAQTITNLELAKRQGLVIVPAVNKIDLPQARIKETKEEIANLLNILEEDVFEISAKCGTNVEKLLRAVLEKIPWPKGNSQEPLKALIFDSKYDPFKGIIAFIRIIDGKISTGDKIYLIQTKTEGEAKEVGYFGPELVATEELKAGEIGYVATGIKEPGKVRVGDTLSKISNQFPIPNLEPLPGYQKPKPAVFVSLYPENSDDFSELQAALDKLKLTDPSFTFKLEARQGLGRGYLCGFLGTLHAEIIIERLKREFELNLIISTPQVPYRILTKENKEIFVERPTDWPDSSKIKEIQEPWAKLEIITPLNYLGQVLEILSSLKGNYKEKKYLGSEKILLNFETPFREIIVDFYDKLKGATQGYASLNYQMLEYRPGDLVKLEILIAGKKEESFSKIIPKERMFKEGKKIVQKLKEILPSQLFAVPIQAVVSGKIVARETIKARRRDVLISLYGGDYTRKRKLLEKQKKGKKELKEKGVLRIPQKVFLEMLRS